MATRSVTIVRGYVPIIRRTEEVFRFFRMFDGYPSGHGLMMAKALERPSKLLNGVTWAETVIENILHPHLEGTSVKQLGSFALQFESQAYDDIDIDYLYVVEGNLKGGAAPENAGSIGLTIACYKAHLLPGETYDKVLIGNPLFSGAPSQYAKWAEGD